MTKTNKFTKFFERYSKNVDTADTQYFWKLSDEIILSIIKEHIKAPLQKNSVILDAGGGTGRWIEKLSKIYKSKFILYDISPSMLKVANEKKNLQSLDDRFQTIEGNLENMKAIDSNSVDFVISIYNPISFVKKPANVFKEITRILKPGGRVLLMGQNYYNATFSKINNYLADGKELEDLKRDKMISWNSSVPKLKTFTQEDLQKLTSDAGLKVKKVYGVPVFAQPKDGDFDSNNESKSDISLKLEKDKKFFDVVYKLEMAYNSNPEVVNRGMNILIVAEK